MIRPLRRPSQNGEHTKAGVCAQKSAATTVKEKTLKYQCVPFASHGYAHGGSAANAAVAATGAHVIGGWTAPQGYPGQAGAAAVTPYAAAGAGTAGHAAALTPGHGGADKSRELFPATPATATGTAPAAPPGTVATRTPTGPGGGTAATTPATGAAAAAATTVRRFWGRPLACNFVFTICWLTLSSFLRERLVLAGTPFSLRRWTWERQTDEASAVQGDVELLRTIRKSASEEKITFLAKEPRENNSSVGSL